jgi:hypothetical protein
MSISNMRLVARYTDSRDDPQQAEPWTPILPLPVDTLRYRGYGHFFEYWTAGQPSRRT